MSGVTDAKPTPRDDQTGAFRRHRFLSYQGYAFPWYVTLLWISFFVGGIIYLVRNILLR